MICQQYISKVKGALGPPGPSPSTRAPRLSQCQRGSRPPLRLLPFLLFPLILEAVQSHGSEPPCLGLNLSFPNS